MLTRLNLSSIEVFSLLSFLGAALRRLYLTNLKKLSIISSVFFLGMLYALINYTNLWVDLLITYRFIFYAIVLYFLKSNEVLRRRQIHSSGRISSIIGFIMLINMAGLPPFPGFFLKIIWLIQANLSLISFLVFIGSSALIIFIYLSFGLKILREINSEFYINFQRNLGGVMITGIIILLRVRPLIWIF